MVGGNWRSSKQIDTGYESQSLGIENSRGNQYQRKISDDKNYISVMPDDRHEDGQ